MKFLVLGANGQVGQALLRSLASLGTVVATTRTGVLPQGDACEALDLADLDTIAPLVRRIAPDAVVNAAAYTAVDRAESEPDVAFRTNAEAPARLAQVCAQLRIALVHYSTDYVFDGQGTHPHREDDPCRPLGVYGASKRAGEVAIETAMLGSPSAWLILRTAWVYGLHGQNFLRTMLRVGGQRDELHVVADQRGTPTPAWLIADATAAVLRQGIVESGIRHLVATGETTWHGFAEAIFDEAVQRGLLPRRPMVTPITTSQYPTPASRPVYSALDSGRLRGEYTLALPDWRLALAATFDRVI